MQALLWRAMMTQRKLFSYRPIMAIPEDSATVREQVKKIGLRRIEQLMEFWGITRHELEMSLRRHPLPVRIVTVSPIKYRHPVTNLTWNGDGMQPDWLRHALLQEGYTVAQLKLDLPQTVP